jgi:hypothetical protein
MQHPTVIACERRVAEAVRTSAEMDGRLAASDSGLMDLLATSREAIAR